MKSIFGLTTRIMRMPFPWNAWVALLGVVNVAGGIWFMQRSAGQAALIAMLFAFGIMVIIYSRLGFVRLLGLGHLICWIPLVGYFAILLVHGTENGLYRWWLVSVITINVASLAIDAIDVGRYVLGEHEPMT